MRALFLIALFLVANVAQAATMSVIPSASSVAQGDLITARIAVNTQGTAINNAESVLTFPPDLLSVVSVSKASSIFTLWVVEPTYSNTAGTVSYNGGLPTPGYNGSGGTVLTVSFLAKKAGTATLGLSEAAIRANDGLGTNVLSGTSGTQLTIAGPVVPVPAPTPAPTPTPVAPTPSTTPRGAITLSSPTHPSEQEWYANAAPTFTWSLPAAADAVQLIADRDEDAAPSVTYRPPIVERTVADLEDGVWYFNLRYRVGSTWSEVASRRVNIDTTAPVIDTALFTYDEGKRVVVVQVQAHDAGSEVASYELVLDNEAPIRIDVNDFIDGVYELKVQEGGTHSVILRVSDHAGNMAEASGEFTVETSVLDTPVLEVGGITVRLLPLLLGMALLTLLSLVLAALAGIAAWRHLLAPAHSRRETRTKVHRAFSLIRSDLDKQVRALRKVKSGKELSAREESLSTSISEKLSELEQYLYDDTDLLK